MAVDVNYLQGRYGELKTERSGWDTAWEQLAELFSPTRWRSDTDTTSHQRPKINGRLVNSVGVLAMRTLAAGMQGGMTSPVRPWFKLTLKGGEQARGANAWLDEVTTAMQTYLHQSNCYNCLHGLYGDLATFGSGLLIEDADADGLHFHLVRAGEYCLDVNGKNEVDTFYRRLSLTAKQMLDTFGDKVPESIRDRAGRADGGATDRYEVIHAVFPRKDLKPGSPFREGKPYASVYWCMDTSRGGKPAILSEGGYAQFPAFAPRWDVLGTDVYGRSPAMDVMPDCRMLQSMTATLRRMQHKMADPPMIADQQMKAYGVNLDAGALNFVSMSTVGQQAKMPVMPIQQPEPNALRFTMEGIKGVEQIIYDGLYTDLFRMLIDDDRRQVTATEIQAKQQEKMILIGPVVERLQKELLEPLIMRTFQLMRDWNAMPEPPDGMDGAELDVQFESVLAQAQKLTATSSIDQGMAFIVGAAQANPEILDILDWDAMGKGYLDRVGIPKSCIREDGEIAAIREQRAQAQQQAAEAEQAQMQAQTAQDLTGAAKNLGQTPAGADGQTLMGTLLGGLGAV